jgi:DNA-binding NtrC family response regulator
MLHALIVDDDPDFLASLQSVIEAEGLTVTGASSLSEARAALAESTPALIITDLALPDGSGMDLVRDLEGDSGPDVLVVSGEATVDTAVEALRRGALDYLTKPIDHHRLHSVLAHVQRARELKAEVGTLRGELRRLGRFGPLIGSSQGMQRIYDMIARVAPTDAPVFIVGESGTGKELVAQAIHEHSRRRSGPYVAINCGAMPPQLIESELFGHEKGSFTGATQQRRGHFERASGGTIFLDEITEMPIDLQVKLLRVLETNTVMRVGGDTTTKVDVRTIAATNRPTDVAVRDGKLREDLLYRLNVFPIVIPPLRERPGDVVMLAEHFVEQLNQTNGTSKTLSDASRQRLAAHDWPGNVREIKNEIHRAFILSEDVIEVLVASGVRSPSAAPAGPSRTIRIGSTLSDVERQVILATLEHCEGDKRRAAEILGISLKTLYNRLNVYEAV